VYKRMSLEANGNQIKEEQTGKETRDICRLFCKPVWEEINCGGGHILFVAVHKIIASEN